MLFCVLFSLPLTIFSTQKLYVEKEKRKKRIDLNVWKPLSLMSCYFFFFFRPKCFVTVKTVCEEHSCDWTIFFKKWSTVDWLTWKNNIFKDKGGCKREAHKEREGVKRGADLSSNMQISGKKKKKKERRNYELNKPHQSSHSSFWFIPGSLWGRDAHLSFKKTKTKTKQNKNSRVRKVLRSVFTVSTLFF